LRENNLTLRSRRFSLKQDGQEFYIENISLAGRLKKYIPTGKIKLRFLKKTFPKSNWSITIDEVWISRHSRKCHRIFDIETNQYLLYEIMFPIRNLKNFLD